jgi:phenylacetate-CoA ligase
MPLIRYSIGDAGAWYRGENCPCGRGLSMLQTVEGRIADSFKTRDGGFVSGAYAFTDFNNFVHPSVKQFQVVQKSLDEIVLRLVPDGEIPQSILDELSHDIRGLFGENVVVHFEIMEAIPPLPSGKHQYAVSELE